MKVSIFEFFRSIFSPHSDWIRSRKTPNMDFFYEVLVFAFRRSRGKQSYAFDKSIKIAPTKPPLSKDFFMIESIWIMHVVTIFESTKIDTVVYTAWKVSKYGVFSGPYFPTFGLNTDRYSVSLRIQSDCEKIRTRKNSVFGHFSRSLSKLSFHKTFDMITWWDNYQSQTLRITFYLK